MDPIGVSIWQMATHPMCNNTKQDLGYLENGHAAIGDGDGDVTSDSEVEGDSVELYEEPITGNACIAIACDDGCVRLYDISDSDEVTYHKSLPRVSGEIAWLTPVPIATFHSFMVGY